MVDPKHISDVFNRNLRVAKRQIEGLSDADCLLQPAVRGNCINWVLGHLIAGRMTIFESLELDPIIEPQKTEIYDTDSEPITSDSEGVLTLELLISLLDQSQEILNQALTKISEDTWLNKPLNERGTKLWERIEFLSWHEAYHVGQLEYLRQLAGTDDKVI